MTEPSGKRPFISYAREDSQTARRLYRDLVTAGAKPWLDSEELIGGQEWELAVRKAVRESAHFLALISANSVNKRGFVQKELRQALDLLDEFPPEDIFIIPIRLDNSSPAHEKLRRLHWIDLFPEYDDGLRRILVSLGISAISGTTRPPAANDVTADRSGSDVPDEIHSQIRGRAERDFPNDFSTQRYAINNELQAWQQLERFAPLSIPQDVTSLILEHAAERFHEEFSTRLYFANNEVNAWRELQSLEVPGMPVDTLDNIVINAEQQFPHDFSTRLYVIQNQIDAWKKLHNDVDL